MISNIYGTSQADAARALIGGNVIADTRNELLKQIIVAVANKTGGGGGAGTVTSVGFTGGLLSVADPTGAAAITVAGTSGGIPYFDSASTWATSAVLAANALLIGGGAGAAPSSTTTGTGVLTALGVAVGNAGAFVTFNGAGGTPASLVLTNATGLPNAGVIGLGTMAVQNASAVAITGGTLAGITGFGLRDTSAAFDLTIQATGTGMSAARTLILDCGNVAHTIALGATANTITFPSAASFTVAGLQLANDFTAANTITLTGLGTSPTAGLSLINTTDAALGAQQVSPGFLLQGEGWRSGNSTNHTVAMRQHVLPVQGSSADPLGRWTLGTSIDGGAFTNVGSWGNDVFGVSTLDFATAQGVITVAGNNRLNYGYTQTSAWTLTADSGLYLQSTNGANYAYIIPKAANTLQMGLDQTSALAQLFTAGNRITSDGTGNSLTFAAGNGRGSVCGALNLSSWTTEATGVVGTLTTIATVDIAGLNLASTKVLKVAGTQVLTAQQTAIADCGAGAVTQVASGATECEDKINLILAMLRVHGIIAT